MNFLNHPIIKDFNLFLDYLQSKPPLSLTTDKGVLKHVDLAALNRQMSSFTSHWIQPKSNQNVFTLLNTFFYIAEVSELIYAQENPKNGKKELAFHPNRLKAYQELTQDEKYFFLLETFWCFVDWDNAYEIRSFWDMEFYKQVTAYPVGKKISISERELKRAGELSPPGNLAIVEMLSAFGFIELEHDEKIEKRPVRYVFPYKTVALTELGAILLGILIEKRPTYKWQREGHIREHTWLASDYLDSDDSDYYDKEDEDDEEEAEEKAVISTTGENEKTMRILYRAKDLKDNEEDAEYNMEDYDFDEQNTPDNADEIDENFEDAFLPHLKGVTVQKRLMPIAVELVSGLYRLKVIFDKHTYRILELGGNHTFDELHDWIQRAFDFDNDHLYTFFMDGKPWSKSADSYSSPYCKDEIPATAIKIGQAGLFTGKNFLYLFDFGSEWHFKVFVEAVLPHAEEPQEPRLIASVGENPEQYPGSEDYDEED
jgi:hypothetical protein